MRSSRLSSISAKGGLLASRQGRDGLESSLLCMRNKNQSGSTAVALDVVFAVLFVVASAFGVWAFMGRQDYKNNSDKKSAAAVESAKKVQAQELQKKFDEDYKNPTKSYKGPVAFGAVSFSYPKTWSAYIDETSSSEPINGYFYPDIIPALNGGTAYSLRVELLSQVYSQVLQSYSSNIKQGKLKASAYVPPKMVGVTNVQPGTRLDGVVNHTQTGDQVGSIVLVQVRDKTLKIYTESPNFMPDFNNIVLANLTYLP
jgi:ABC-type multidrug transport system fused ATPase/permease subunit